MHPGDVLRQTLKIKVPFLHHLRQLHAGVDRHRQDVAQQVRLGETHRLGVHSSVSDRRTHQVLGVLAIHDGECWRVADHLGVAAQDAMADRVKRAAPKPGSVAADQVLHALHHLAGCLVGESQQQDAIDRDSLLEQVRHAVGQRARLARARAREHQRRPRRGRHGG